MKLFVVILLNLLINVLPAQTQYCPDDINEIVKDRIFEPMNNCLPEILVDSIKNGTLTFEMLNIRFGFSTLENKEDKQDDNRLCFLFPYNYMMSDSLSNILYKESFSSDEEYFQMGYGIALIVSKCFIDYIKTGKYNCKTEIEEMVQNTKREKLPIDTNAIVLGKYIPKDLNDAISYMEKLTFDSTGLVHFLSTPEEIAVFDEISSYGSVLYTISTNLFYSPNRLLEYLYNNVLTDKNNNFIYYDIFLRILHRKLNKHNINLNEIINKSRNDKILKDTIKYYSEISERLNHQFYLYKAHSIIEKRKRESRKK